METKHHKCLVLNADYTPLAIVDWKRAITWSIIDYKHRHIEIIDFYKNDYIAGSNNKKFPVPAVIKTTKYLKIHNTTVNFSRKNLFIRDNYTCQYCGIKKEVSKLTYDHVIPKSLFKNSSQSPTSWTNIVTACMDCNRKKGNKTPHQANMPLKNLPIAPNKSSKYLPMLQYITNIGNEIPQEWKIYLPDCYTS